MTTYKHKKKNFIISVIICILTVALFFTIFSTFESSIFFRYGMPVISLCFFLYNIYLLYIDYRFVVEVNDEVCKLSIMGQQQRIEFNKIVSIKYKDYKHLNFGKCIVVETNSNKRVVISNEYYNYINLWQQVVNCAIVCNPDVIIEPKVMEKTGSIRGRFYD